MTENISESWFLNNTPFQNVFTDPDHRKYIEITRPVFGEIFAGAIAKRFILLYEYDYIELHVLVFYGYNWR